MLEFEVEPLDRSQQLFRLGLLVGAITVAAAIWIALVGASAATIWIGHGLAAVLAFSLVRSGALVHGSD